MVARQRLAAGPGTFHGFQASFHHKASPIRDLDRTEAVEGLESAFPCNATKQAIERIAQ